MRAIAYSLIATLLTGTAATAQLRPDQALQQVLQRMEDGLVVSPEADDTSVTIYPDNLAMITDRRRVYLPKGRSTIKFEGVTDLIIPQTVVLREFSGFTLERNFDYDLMSKAALFESAVGETVSIVRTNRVTGEVKRQDATIVSASASGNQWQETVQGVVFEIDGQYEAFSCSGGAETIAFDTVPEQLSSIPVLSIDVDATEAGPQDVVISYLTSGLGWAADYRVDLQDDASADVFGWLSISNNTAKRFEGVPLAIIAGDLQRMRDTRGVAPKRKNFNAMCWPKGSTKTGINTAPPPPRMENFRSQKLGLFAAPAPIMQESGAMADQIVVTGSRMAQQEDVGDYKLYRVPVPITVAAYQTKQIAFVDSDDVPTQRRIEFDVFQDMTPYEPVMGKVVYDVDNSREGNLGKPLPKGTMRIFEQTRNKQTFFTGEDRIGNLAVDLPVELGLGQSRSVFLAPHTNLVDGDDPVLRFSYDITNALDIKTTARITVDDPVMASFLEGLTNETHGRVPDKPGLVWDVAVPANDQETFSFDLPLEGVAIFQPLHRSYLKKRTGEEIRSVDDLDIEYFLKDTGTPVDVYQYLGNTDLGYASLTVSSRYDLSNTKKTRKDEYRFVTETHEVTNTSSVSQDVVIRDYDMDDERCLLVRESNIPPAAPQLRAWRISLGPNETKTLTYTYENTCR